MKKSSLCNIIAYLLVAGILLSVLPFVITKPFGIEPYGIISNSMEPAYPVGSVIYVKKISPEQIQKDDVITFSVSAKNKNVATHRVVLHDTEKQLFYTKGDNNEQMDTNPVSYQNLLGKAIFCVPYLGYFYQQLVSFTGMMLCAILLITAIVLWYFCSQWKKEEAKHAIYQKR